MTVHIERLDDRIVFTVGPRYGDLVKQIPGARYRNLSQDWTAPLSWGTCLAARGVFGDELEVGSRLAAWAWWRHEQIEEIRLIKEGHNVFKDPEERFFPEQVIGATFLYAAERALLADDMRVGKTVQTIGALKVLSSSIRQPFPALIVCPNSMKHKWAEEIATWAPGVTTAVVSGTATQRRKQIASGADVVIINWESLKTHSRLAAYGSTRLTDKQREDKELNAVPWRTVIADEAHRAKDPKAQQTRAWWHLSHGAHYRFALTGTPIANNPADLWAVMHGIAPEEWPSKTAFIARYTNNSLNYWGGLEVLGLNPRTQDEFYKLLDPRFLRRTKAGRVTPVFDKRPVEMHPKQAKAYDQMAQHMLAALDSGLLHTEDPLVRLGRLRQIACGMPVLDDTGAVVSLEEPSCKVDALLEILEEAPGEPLVVFAASRKLIELCARVLERKKISVALVTGAVSAAERAFNVQAFQNGERQVALCTTGAGAEGITLNRADRCVFLERDWSMVKNKQAQARIDPIGENTGSPLIIDVVAIGTVEQAVHDVVAGKVARLEEITRDEARLRAALTGAHAA